MDVNRQSLYPVNHPPFAMGASRMNRRRSSEGKGMGVGSCERSGGLRG